MVTHHRNTKIKCPDQINSAHEVAQALKYFQFQVRSYQKGTPEQQEIFTALQLLQMEFAGKGKDANERQEFAEKLGQMLDAVERRFFRQHEDNLFTSGWMPTVQYAKSAFVDLRKALANSNNDLGEAFRRGYVHYKAAEAFTDHISTLKQSYHDAISVEKKHHEIPAAIRKSVNTAYWHTNTDDTTLDKALNIPKNYGERVTATCMNMVRGTKPARAWEAFIKHMPRKGPSQ